MKKFAGICSLVALCSLVAPMAMAKTAAPNAVPRMEKRATAPHHKNKSKRSRSAKTPRGSRSTPKESLK